MMPNSKQVNSQFFHNGELSMQYTVAGHGQYALLIFHGFGRSHRDFTAFVENLHPIFTIYAFDIFFHEGSNIGNRKPDANPLKPEELKEYIQKFMQHIGAEKIWMMGYSLGGRIALKIAEIMPENTGGLYLFAPDGLKVNAWYAISSFTSPGRALFRFFIKHNRFFMKTLNFLNRIKIVSDKRKAFILANVETTQMQWQVYNVWTFLRFIQPQLKVLSASLSANEVSVDLFLGKYDRIIPVKNARKLKKLFPKLHLHVLQCGHLMLTPRIAQKIKENNWYQLPD